MNSISKKLTLVVMFFSFTLIFSNNFLEARDVEVDTGVDEQTQQELRAMGIESIELAKKAQSKKSARSKKVETTGSSTTNKNLKDLWDAIYNVDKTKVEALVKQDSSIVDEQNVEDQGRTALMVTAEILSWQNDDQNKNTLDKILLILIDSSKNVKITDNNGLTALHFAAAAGKIDVVKKLVEKGAKVDAVAKGAIFNEETTPLLNAIFRNRNDVIRYLLENRTNPANINLTGNNGLTPLMAIIPSNDVDMVKYFLNQGAKLTADQDGNTPLHVAWSTKGALINPEITELLISKSADVNAKSKNGTTPLHFACLVCNFPVAQKLIAKGAYINAADNNGNTPLMLASISGTGDLIQFLIDNKADVKAKDKYGKTALHRACYSCNIAAAQKLVANGADINAADNSGKTPLINAVSSVKSKSKIIPVVQFLIDNKAEVNAKTANGDTALKIALAAGKTEIVDLLKKAGATE